MRQGGQPISKNNIGDYISYLSVFAAVAHISCIDIGETYSRAQIAPEPIVRSAIEGTLLATLGTIVIFVISALLLPCAAYALSAANLILDPAVNRAGI